MSHSFEACVVAYGSAVVQAHSYVDTPGTRLLRWEDPRDAGRWVFAWEIECPSDRGPRGRETGQATPCADSDDG
jgi:hypothetical protein